jgi:acyl carrier protein
MNVQSKVTAIVGRAAHVAAKDVRPDTKLSELGMDSLEKIECVLALEEVFQVEIADEDLWRIRIVQDAIDLVTRAMAGSAPE